MAHPRFHTSICAAAALLLGLSSAVTPAAASTSTVIGTVDFSPIDFPGAEWTVASGVNDYGQVVGTYHDIQGSHGFLLSGGKYSTLDVPGVMGINLPRHKPWASTTRDRSSVRTRMTPTPRFRSCFPPVHTPKQDVCQVHQRAPAAALARGPTQSSRTLDCTRSTMLAAKLVHIGICPTRITSMLSYRVSWRAPLTSQFDCTIDWPGSIGTEIYGINDGGQMVGYSTFGPGPSVRSTSRTALSGPVRASAASSTSPKPTIRCCAASARPGGLPA